MTKRTGAHELHPKFNLANARRLIAALSNADSAEIAREKPLEFNGSFAARGDIFHLPVDPGSAERRNPKRVPVAYNQRAWSCMLQTETWASNSTPMTWSNSCGTAACIAGFAWLLREADKGEGVEAHRFVEELADGIGPDASMDALEEFLGIDRDASSQMSGTLPCLLLDGHSVQPRHAVAMLERFIETGKVDWVRALGLVEVKKAKRDWKGWRPWRKKRWTEWLPTEEEIGRQAEERRDLRRAKVEHAERRGERGCRA